MNCHRPPLNAETATNALKKDQIALYVFDIVEESNDFLMTKLNLSKPESLKLASEKRQQDWRINIMKNSAKIAKARAIARVKRKYDLIITGATLEESEGMPIIQQMYTEILKLAPSLNVGRDWGDKSTNDQAKDAFNVIVNRQQRLFYACFTSA